MKYIFKFRIDNPRHNINVDDLVEEDLANIGVFFVTDSKMADGHHIIVWTKDPLVSSERLLTILNEKYHLDAVFINRSTK